MRNGQTGTSWNNRERANWIQFPGIVSQKKTTESLSSGHRLQGS